MGFALIMVGVLVGKLWTWVGARQLLSAAITQQSPALQLCGYTAVAVLTGVVIGLVEVHVFPTVPDAWALSKGLIAGFAWSPWFIASARRLHAHTVWAVSYLAAAPVLVLVAVLGGYLSFHLDHRLA